MDIVAIAINIGFAYNKAWFADEASANAFAKKVTANGDKAYGGYFDGMRLGKVATYEWKSGQQVWEVEYGGTRSPATDETLRKDKA